jgi:hypothetical protein
MMMRKLISMAVVGAALALAAPHAAFAHHSFAAFFDPDKIVRVTGTVTDFKFANPHGTITLDVKKGGKVQEWRVETNAPVVLMRRGWSKDVIKPGDVVTIEGWLARDGKPYMRLRQAFDDKGKQIGNSAFGVFN